jgi:hypothetical protein
MTSMVFNKNVQVASWAQHSSLVGILSLSIPLKSEVFTYDMFSDQWVDFIFF